MTTIDRAAIAREAAELEAAGADWEGKHVRAMLGIKSRSTLYNTPWLMRIAKPVGRRGKRWNPREVRNAQAIAAGRVEKPLSRTGS